MSSESENGPSALCAGWVMWSSSRRCLRCPIRRRSAEEVLAACDQGGGTRDVATRFKVSESWVRRIKPERRELNKTAPLLTRRRIPLWTPLVVDGAINGEILLGWVRQHLVPTLHPGDIVVMDNLPAHKVAGVAQAIASHFASHDCGSSWRDRPPTTLSALSASPTSQAESCSGASV